MQSKKIETKRPKKQFKNKNTQQNKNKNSSQLNRGVRADINPSEWSKSQEAPRNNKKVGKKTINNAVNAGFYVSNTKSLVVGTPTMVQPAMFETTTLSVALMTYLSRLFYTNVISAASANDTTVNYNSVYGGVAYLGLAIQQVSQGGTMDITQLPRIFDILLQLLSKKRIPFAGGGVVEYTPQWSATYSLNTTFVTPTGSYYSLIEPGNANVYDITPSVIPSNQDNYSIFLKIAGDQSYGGQCVETKSSKGLFMNDPSVYARSYVYFGTGGNEVSGLYSNSELECPFYYPLFSRFIPYNTDDKVISRVFHPQSGGISTVIGQSLVQDRFKPAQLKNPIPPVYKYIDFFQLYMMVGSWLVGLFNCTPANVEGNNMFNKPQQIPMNVEDFCWLLRQAVLSQFPEQCHGQFVAPVSSVPSQNNSVFQPFIVDSITTPTNNASKMLLPQFIVENISMLKSRSYVVDSTKNSAKYNSTPQKLVHNHYPVWGIYSGDVVPFYTFIDAVTGQEQGIFQLPGVMPDARLYDGLSNATANEKVNVNLYVDQLIDTWNNQMEIFASNKSSGKLTPINTDIPKCASLLYYTRILNKVSEETKKTGLVPFRIENPADRFISNNPYVEKKKLKTGKPVKDIPPSDYYDLHTQTILSKHTLSTEVAGALRYYLIPSLRLDLSGSDFLTMGELQIYLGEICSTSNRQGAFNPSSPEIYRYFTIGNLGVAGVFGNQDTTNIITESAQVLFNDNQGSNFLSALLGGLSSVIPVVGPLISQVVSSLGS